MDFEISFFPSHVSSCLLLYFFKHTLTQNASLNRSDSISMWTAFNPYGRRLELQILLCLIAWLLCADKDEFTQFSFLRGNNT